MHMTHLLVVSSRKHFKKDTATELRILSPKSVGSNDSTISTQITQTIDPIRLLDSQVSKIASDMESITPSLDSVIMTILGIGFINGGMILGEIGNITQFSKPHQTACIYRSYPAVYQSGNFNVNHTKISKCSSLLLR